MQLRLVDVLVKFLRQRAGRSSIVPERLLHHHPCGARQPRLRKPLDNRREQKWWDLEIEHRRRCALDRLTHAPVSRRIIEVPCTYERRSANRSITFGSSCSRWRRSTRARSTSCSNSVEFSGRPSLLDESTDIHSGGRNAALRVQGPAWAGLVRSPGRAASPLRPTCCHVRHRHVLSVSTRPRPNASIRPHRPGMSRSSR